MFGHSVRKGAALADTRDAHGSFVAGFHKRGAAEEFSASNGRPSVKPSKRDVINRTDQPHGTRAVSPAVHRCAVHRPPATSASHRHNSKPQRAQLPKRAHAAA